MKAVRTGVCVLIVFAVLAFGGVEIWGQAILEMGAAVLLLLWAILALRNRRADLHWNWLYVPLLGLGAIALGQWLFGLTAYSYATKMDLRLWSALLLLVFLARESFNTAEDARYFAWFLLIFSFSVSLFGIVQHFTFNGKIYWSLALPGGAGPFGPFVNRDDFAGFVELTAPLGLAMLLQGAWRKEHLPVLSLLTVVPIGALILSASRGGILGFGLAVLVLLALWQGRRAHGKQWLVALIFALGAGGFIVWLGTGEAVHRFGELTGGELTWDGRVLMDRDAWRIFLRHPWTGTGVGTFEAVFPGYQSFYSHRVVNHAHNDFLELLAETGGAGGLCGLAFLVLLFWRGISNLRSDTDNADRAFRAGALAACSGLLLHSLVDFNLRIPSNALLFLILASAATSVPLIRSHTASPIA